MGVGTGCVGICDGRQWTPLLGVPTVSVESPSVSRAWKSATIPALPHLIPMRTFAIIAGIVIALAVLLAAFETVVLPRRVRRQFRITSWFYRNTWSPWARP